MSLVLDRITLTYPDGDRRLTALDTVGFSAKPGELVAVTGPSGSGKSSLLAVAGALAVPDSGVVRIADIDVTALKPAQRDRIRSTHIGFVFQQSNLLSSLTARDQLLLVARLTGRRRKAAHRALELLDRVGLAGKADKLPHRLSGGERQRVGIARALMGEPALLLVDEPTSALDRERGESVVRLLRDITHDAGAATVMVTHDLQYLELTDRAVHMRDGRLSPAESREPADAANHVVRLY